MKQPEDIEAIYQGEGLSNISFLKREHVSETTNVSSARQFLCRHFVKHGLTGADLYWVIDSVSGLTWNIGTYWPKKFKLNNCIYESPISKQRDIFTTWPKYILRIEQFNKLISTYSWRWRKILWIALMIAVNNKITKMSEIYVEFIIFEVTESNRDTLDIVVLKWTFVFSTAELEKL